MITVKEMIAQLPPERRRRIEKETQKLIAEEKAIRKVREEFFHTARKQWLQERPRGADLAGMIAHPAYQRIIQMGQDAIPLILQELEKRPDHWFPALRAITEANPVPEHAQGNLAKMTDAWLTWGHENGYFWQSDVD